MTESSLYERLGGAFAIAAVVDHFSEAIVRNPIVGQTSENPALRDWHTDNLERLPGLKFMRTLWVCEVAGGPQRYAATKPGSTTLGLEEAHRELKISPAEFDEVAAELGRTLTSSRYPSRRRKRFCCICRTQERGDRGVFHLGNGASNHHPANESIEHDRARERSRRRRSARDPTSAEHGYERRVAVSDLGRPPTRRVGASRHPLPLALVRAVWGLVGCPRGYHRLGVTIGWGLVPASRWWITVSACCSGPTRGGSPRCICGFVSVWMRSTCGRSAASNSRTCVLGRRFCVCRRWEAICGSRRTLPRWRTRRASSGCWAHTPRSRAGARRRGSRTRLDADG